MQVKLSASKYWLMMMSGPNSCLCKDTPYPKMVPMAQYRQPSPPLLHSIFSSYWLTRPRWEVQRGWHCPTVQTYPQRIRDQSPACLWSSPSAGSSAQLSRLRGRWLDLNDANCQIESKLNVRVKEACLHGGIGSWSWSCVPPLPSHPSGCRLPSSARRPSSDTGKTCRLWALHLPL